MCLPLPQNFSCPDLVSIPLSPPWINFPHCLLPPSFLCLMHHPSSFPTSPFLSSNLSSLYPSSLPSVLLSPTFLWFLVFCNFFILSLFSYSFQSSCSFVILYSVSSVFIYFPLLSQLFSFPSSLLLLLSYFTHHLFFSLSPLTLFFSCPYFSLTP